MTVTPSNGFTGTVVFSASGFPSGVTYSFNPASSTSGSSLSVTVPSGTATGNSTITVTGTSGTLSASTTFTLTVTSNGTVSTPTFNPLPGNYSSAQPVTISDTTPRVGGSLHHKRHDANGCPSPVCTTVTVSANTTIEAIAAAPGYNNSPIATGVYTISPVSEVQVNLASFYNVWGIGTVGTVPQDGGLETSGKAYNSATLGTTATYQGFTFTLGPVNALDAVSDNVKVTLPAGSYSQLLLLGLGAFGAQQNQNTIVTYTDGQAPAHLHRAYSDWWNSSKFPGETIVTSPANIISSNGSLETQPVNLYGYTFNLTPGKTAASVTLPGDRDVIFLAMALANAAATPTFNPAPGSYTSAQTVNTLRPAPPAP